MHKKVASSQRKVKKKSDRKRLAIYFRPFNINNLQAKTNFFQISLKSQKVLSFFESFASFKIGLKLTARLWEKSACDNNPIKTIFIQSSTFIFKSFFCTITNSFAFDSHSTLERNFNQSFDSPNVFKHDLA